MAGIIALDIDGTITPKRIWIPPAAVIQFLSSLDQEEWKIVIITGRTFATSHPVSSALPFPHYLAIQNGALTLEMPTQKIVSKHYIDSSVFPALEVLCEGEPADVVLYPGFEHQDRCYYRSHQFASDMFSYVKKRRETLSETWIDIASFSEAGIQSFASLKYFGNYETVCRMADQLENVLHLHAPVCRDPLGDDHYVVQGTHSAVSKGKALQDFCSLYPTKGPVIAAGDDWNDYSMFEEADVSVVMETAPSKLVPYADVIAPSADKNGLIDGLIEAIKRA